MKRRWILSLPLLLLLPLTPLSCTSEADPGGTATGDVGVVFAGADAYAKDGGAAAGDGQDGNISANPESDAAIVEDGAPAAVEDAGGPQPDTTSTDSGAGDSDTPPGLCEGLLEGTSCDADGDPCTLDICDAAGQCVFSGTMNTCNAEQLGQPCWTFTCSKKKGCIPTVWVDGASCDDGNPCTLGDTCQNLDFKVCVGTPAPVDDSNPCTDDTCVGGTVTHTPVDGLPCEIDGNNGTCNAGDCETQTCTPVDGGWTEWALGSCTAACGGGTQIASRTCTAPSASCGGLDCVGDSQVTQPCNEEACPTEVTLLTCPAVPATPCLAPATTTSFSNIANTGATGDSYGVSVVRGPGNTVAALFRQKEWFQRMDEAGNIIVPAVSLPEKNSSVAASALGDGFPAFYGPELAYDAVGDLFGIARASQMTPKLYFYTVDGSGLLHAGPITVSPPGGGQAYNRGPGLVSDNQAWFAVWAVSAPDRIVIVKIAKNMVVDTAFGDNGFVTLDAASPRYPEIAVGSGRLGVVWGDTSFGVAVVDAGSGTVISKTENNCPTQQGTSGDGHDITWNAAMSEFGVLLSGQGAGPCKAETAMLTQTLHRLTPAGTWTGTPLPVSCGWNIGAGHRGGISARPDGRYMVATARYHGGPYCSEGASNGSLGTKSLDLLTVNPTAGTVTKRRHVDGIGSIYVQVDAAWTGSKTTVVVPKGVSGAGVAYLYE